MLSRANLSKVNMVKAHVMQLLHFLLQMLNFALHQVHLLSPASDLLLHVQGYLEA